MTGQNSGLWVVSACFNEAQLITTFIEAVLSLPMVDQLVLIDDGSRDDTVPTVQAWISAQRQQGDTPRLTLIELTRNFGKEQAMLAGLDHARGHCGAVVLIDSDLQHPPDLIASMYGHWQAGAEMVTAIRDDRDQESRFRIASASGFYTLFNHLTDSIELIDGAGDFRLLSAPVVEALTALREGHRFSKGLYPWTGFRSVQIAYQRPKRSHGSSSWNLRRLVRYGLDGLFSFSTTPLRVWSVVGVLISLVSLLYALYLVIHTWISGIDVPGYASLIVAILFLGGIQLIGIGILGEYIGRIYMESKRRPAYFVRRILQGSEENA